jgi:hypothetical protein
MHVFALFAVLNGNALLARAVKLHPMPSTYAVPLNFTGRLIRPLPFGFRANATLYFQAPDKQMLVLTNAPRSLSNLLAQKYDSLDTIASRWPSEYRVTKVTRATSNGLDVYHLDTKPTYTSDIVRVTFDLLASDLSTVGITWIYKNGDTIRLGVTNEHVGTYLLPSAEHIEVTMHGLSVTADGTAGEYIIDAPPPTATPSPTPTP